jgi:hypothetical protein
MLMYDAIEAKAPDCAATKGRQQKPSEGVAEGIPEPALQRLQAEFSGIGIVIPLRHLNDVGTNQPGQINGHGHFEPAPKSLVY